MKRPLLILALSLAVVIHDRMGRFDHLATQLMDGAFVRARAKTQLVMVEARGDLRRQRFQRAQIIFSCT